MEGHWKFRGGEWSEQPKLFIRESMKLYWNFQGGMRVQTKKPSMGKVWIFSGTIQFNNNVKFYEFFKINKFGNCRPKWPPELELVLLAESK